MQKLGYLFFPIVLLLLAGCTQDSPPEKRRTSVKNSSKADVKLSVLVLDDPQLAQGLNLLRGEWSERSGGEMAVHEGTVGSLEFKDPLEADLVVFPSGQLGAFVLCNQLRPLRTSVLESEEFNKKDLLPLVRNRVLPFGNKVYAVSLGEAPLILATRRSEPLGEREPTAEEKTFRSSPGLEYPHVVELLVRVVGYSGRGGRSALLFDPQNMRPRINSEPFRRALEEVQYSSGNLEKSNSVETALITCPQLTPMALEEKERMVFRPIPPGAEVYNYLRETWEKAESPSPRVILGFSGRSVAVTRSSRNASSAFKLLQWLTTREIAMQLSQRSSATVWFRKSHLPEASAWLKGNRVGEEALGTVTDLLSLPAERCYLVPRIPAIVEYFTVLESSIEENRNQEKDSQILLQGVAESWEAITERLGRENQQKAYRMHLGL